MRTSRRTQHRLWFLLTSLGLVLLSAATYFVHFLIFRDVHHIFIYLVGDIAFVFLEVLMVSLVIHRILDVREVRQRLKKLNVVVGVFFSEIGSDLIRLLTAWDEHQAEDRRRLMVRENWTGAEFDAAEQWLLAHEHRTELDGDRCRQLRCLLVHRREALLQLLQNPNLLEHESFTELLRMVFHLAEELDLRENLGALPEEDYRHLGEDVRRAHTALVLHWLDYMRHLKQEYPYLFSLAMRTNPFDADASPVVGGTAPPAAGPACAPRPAPG